MRRFRVIRLSVSLAAFCPLLPAGAGEVAQGPAGLHFREDFRFSGNHAASVLDGAATTVWWDESDWDVRGDTHFIGVSPISDEINNRFHIDVHKALSANPRDGRLSNTVNAIGGDGSAGVGVMHLDYQDILSARLRNPMLISAGQPGVVRFHTSAFTTSGHWWEVAITPTATVAGGEATAVPGQGEAGFPFAPGGDRQPGPGHSAAVDSINLVSFGANDVPCLTGWFTRFGVTRSLGGIRSEYVNPVGSLSDYLPTSPAHSDTLVHWQLEFRPDRIDLLADLDAKGTMEPLEHWNLSVPWNEVHVQLLGVAYQADHHPQAPCFLGHIRELKWRDVEVYPVKFAATEVWPKNDGATPIGRERGWMSHDLRDIQRFGPSMNGAPQPNGAEYEVHQRGVACNDAGFPCFRQQPTLALQAAVPASAALQLASAKFVYDTKSYRDGEVGGTLALNGQALGRLPGHASVPGTEAQAWARRSLDLPVTALAGGSASLAIGLDPGLHLDRMEIEYGFSAVAADGGTLFGNGFEGALAGAAQPHAGATKSSSAAFNPKRRDWNPPEVYGSGWFEGPMCSAPTR